MDYYEEIRIMNAYCKNCDKESLTEMKEEGITKAILCDDCPGSHASGDYSYVCDDKYCRCCQ